MKIVCVGDAYITDVMMRDGLRPFLGKDDSVTIFFFGDRNPADENYISLDECEDLIAFVFAFCKILLECLPAYDTICLDSGADDFNEFIDVIKRGGCFNQ